MKLNMEGTYDGVADAHHSNDIPAVNVVWSFSLIRAPMCFDAAVSVGLEVVDLITSWAVTLQTVHELVG